LGISVGAHFYLVLCGLALLDRSHARPDFSLHITAQGVSALIKLLLRLDIPVGLSDTDMEALSSYSHARRPPGRPVSSTVCSVAGRVRHWSVHPTYEQREPLT
jgi:hypothetical protein